MHWLSIAGGIATLRAGLALGKHRRLPFITLSDSTATLTTAQSGAIILVTAACTITLPTAAVSKGVWYLIYSAVDDDVTVLPETTVYHDTLITFNDATADSVSYAQANEHIGACHMVICDGTSWIALALTQKHTYTVTT